MEHSDPVPDPVRLPLHLHRWLDPTILGIASISLVGGFGQYGAVAALGDVAKSFGRITGGASIADQAGLSGTELGIALAILRLASLGGLFLSGLADRFGRRQVLLASCSVGLVLTALAATSPGYWWFVAIFALGRPFLTTSNALAQVMASEQTDTRNRAKAVALVAGGYGVGVGIIAIIHGLGSWGLGFRGLFGLAVVPLAAMPLIAKYVTEPDRFVVSTEENGRSLPIFGAIESAFRGRLLVVFGIFFFISVVTGPANSFVFLYGENILGLSPLSLALMVVGAGGTGLLGLICGERFADRVGRRPTAAIAMIGLAPCSMLIYSGSKVALFVGYLLGVVAASTLAPAAGALVNELFPTTVRASVAGWLISAGVLGAVVGLLCFGAIADVGNRFSVAAVIIFATAIPAAGLFLLLPETRGLEPEELWPRRA